jgi:ribosome maturation factor RimP
MQARAHHPHVPGAASPEAGEPRVDVRASAERVREQAAQLALPVVAAHHCELVSLEYRREPNGWVLRLFVERIGHDPRNAVGGVTLEQCSKISRDLGTALEVAELIEHAFHLEVSSPGLDRPLVSLADWKRFVGLRAKLHLAQPIEAHPQRKVYRGEILGLRGEGPHTQIALREDDVGEVALPFAGVAKAHLLLEGHQPAPKPGKAKKHKPKHGGKAEHQTNDPSGRMQRSQTSTEQHDDASGEKTGR